MTRIPSPLPFLILFFVLVMSAAPVAAQLTMQQVAFPAGSPIDVTGYPNVRLQVRILDSGTPVQLQKPAFSILETNIAYDPSAVTYSGNGIHVIEWTVNRFGFFQCAVVASHNGYTASTTASANVGKVKGANVVVQDSTGRLLPRFYDAGVVEAGETDTLKFRIVATEAALAGDPQQERPILLESVTTTRPEFQVIWKGSYGSGALPTNIISPLSYRVDVVCKPTSNEPLFDVLTVTFEGGMRTTCMLIANAPTYPRRTILELRTPNGGENLAPCQEVPIRWVGMLPGFKAHLEVSTNDGRTWEYIDSTADSSYSWRVPATYSDSVRIRVYQKFESSGSIWLHGPKAPVTNIAYSADGRYLAAAYTNGLIQEWDVVSATKANSYQVEGMGSSRIRALTYVGTTRSIVASISRPTSKGGTLQRFDPGTTTVVATASIPNDLAVADVASNASGTSLYLLPEFASRIPVFNPQTLTEKQAIQLPGTAASAALNGNSLAASLLNGEVITFNSETGVETDRSQTGLAEALGPFANKMATSVTGRLVALAGQSLVGLANGPKEQRTFVYDMQEDRVVKILYREGSDVVNLGFSPSDAFLGFGFGFNPQFVVYDLARGTTLPPTGSSAGHQNELSDIAFGPDAATVATSSTDSTYNLLLRRVSIPETDMSDAVFSIAPVDLSITPIALAPRLVATRTDSTIDANVCNTGRVLAIITSARALGGSWLSVIAPTGVDTVAPGECLTLKLQVFARDTGLLTDTIELVACGVRFLVPVQMYIADRNVQVVTTVEDFGDLCVGSSRKQSFVLVRNDDAIPLHITNVYVEGGLGADFRVATPDTDTILAPGATLDIEIEFTPRKLGLDTGVVIIRYEHLESVKRTMIVTGRGSGADLQLSHTTLPFIPEIPLRTVTITNHSNNDVQITAADVTSGQPFIIRTPLPQTLAPNQSMELTIEYLGGAVAADAQVALTATPCAAQTNIGFTLYSGSTTITAPSVVADPRSDTTSIPIYASITEAVPYKGVRSFTGTLRVDPRLYLAHSISSAVGQASIVSQDVVEGWRHIVFTVEGNFEGVHELVRLVGYAGMAETDSSVLSFDSATAGFGASVTMAYESGMLRIEHPDPTRRIVQKAQFTVAGIVPMPVQTHGHAMLNVTEATPLTIRILDAQGVVVASTHTNAPVGPMEQQLPVSALVPGAYVVEYAGTTTTVRTPLVVIH